MRALTRRSATELATAVQLAEVTAREVTDEHLARIDAVDGSIHAFLHVDYDARARPMLSMQKRAAGRPLGPLAGVPVALQGMSSLEGSPTTAGSRAILRAGVRHDSTVVSRCATQTV